jgi:hypothetical protein
MTMHLTRNHSEIETPLQSVIGNAAVGCIVCLMLVGSAGRPVIERLQVGWAEMLVFALGPILTALTILYLCGARHELSGLKRLACLFLASCATFVVVFLTLVTVLTFAWTFVGLARVGPGLCSLRASAFPATRVTGVPPGLWTCVFRQKLDSSTR